ncbi:MAG: tetratricopeptide repeat protein [Saprospiraceae bacterium]|jgi:tetratricopeptide (TPR) repeat protein|nr:tetratricopeptide repeat protein [Saprospiraceae bacterium]
MKHLLTLVLSGFLLIHAHAQTDLTAADWQSDLRFLQKTVHKDYAFLFKKITAEKWDAEVEKLHQTIPALQPHEILAGFGRIVSSFGYGHTDIGWSQAPVKSHIVPMNLYWFSEGIRVEGCPPAMAGMLGAKLLRVEGLPVEKALEALRPLLPVENEQYFRAYILDFLLIPEALHAQGITKSLKQTITMTLERDGKSYEKTFDAEDAFRFPRRYGFVAPGGAWLTVRDSATTPLYLKNLNKNYSFEYLPEHKTMYVRQSQQLDDKDESIAAFYKRVFDFVEKNDVERFVLDVRLNGGGNNYKNKPIVQGLIRAKKINQPGKLFVLIGRRTFSACQNLVNELHNYTDAIFVGEPTAENINFYGDNRRVELPKSKLPVFLSFAWWQDKPQWENDDWLAPQLAAELSFDDYRSNRDPVLEAALQVSDNDPVLDPMAHLRALFQSGQTEQLETDAQRIVADRRYRYINFEDRINRAGYDLLNGEKTDRALSVFQLNTRLFPHSANAWDSLGEANLQAGQTEKAVEFYQKAIALDPDGSVGENARRMLKEMAETKK